MNGALSWCPSAWENDPAHLQDGFLKHPAECVVYWYHQQRRLHLLRVRQGMTAPLSSIWTARASPFDAPKTPAKKIAYLEVERLYERAKEDFPVSQGGPGQDRKAGSVRHPAFPYRLRQPYHEAAEGPSRASVYACGGTETEAIDYIFVTKVFRKFESLNLFDPGEIRGLIAMMDSPLRARGYAREHRISAAAAENVLMTDRRDRHGRHIL